MVFVGCVLLGLGLGMLFDEVVAGIVIGVGVAFVIGGVLDRLKPWLGSDRGRGRSKV